MLPLINKDNYFIKSDYIVAGGSKLYGYSVPNSDEDIRGFVIPPKEYVLGLSSFDQFELIEDNVDVVIYNVKKFFKLAVIGNPNIIELLFSQPKKAPKVTINSNAFLTQQFFNNSRYFARNCYETYLNPLKDLETRQRQLYHALRLQLQINCVLESGTLKFPLQTPYDNAIRVLKNGTIVGDLLTLEKAYEELLDANSSKRIEKFPEKVDMIYVNQLLADMYEYKWSL